MGNRLGDNANIQVVGYNLYYNVGEALKCKVYTSAEKKTQRKSRIKMENGKRRFPCGKSSDQSCYYILIDGKMSK